MISLHRSMHSSQMYTPGPAMSFFTCFCDFPQNEHLSRSPPSPIRATYVLPAPGAPAWVRRTDVRAGGPRLADSTLPGPGAELSTPEPGVASRLNHDGQLDPAVAMVFLRLARTLSTRPYS